jgi:hypothetical protein
LLGDAAEYLVLQAASPEEMVASQRGTRLVKRDACRGRLWLRRRAGRPLPEYPGLDLSASAGGRLRGVADAAQESLFRTLVDRRYPD